MKIVWGINELLVRMIKWDYRIYINPEGFWKAERRRNTSWIWEDFNQNLIPQSVVKQAVKYWKHQKLYP